MTEFWEAAFLDKQLMWGLEPSTSAVAASERFAQAGAKAVLIPGVGYGRNVRPFLDRGMAVTGIEISKTAIALARARLGLEIPIHHGSVDGMPFDARRYDGVFCYGLIYLLDGAGRARFLGRCHDQLAHGGHLFFTVISKKAPMYGSGARLGEDRYERVPNLGMYFYDADSVRREFGPFGLIEQTEVDEPGPHGGALPFIQVLCTKR